MQKRSNESVTRQTNKRRGEVVVERRPPSKVDMIACLTLFAPSFSDHFRDCFTYTQLFELVYLILHLHCP